MATTGTNGNKLGAFQTQLYPSGLDLHRMPNISRQLGTWRAASTASFRAGSAVMLNSSGEVVAFDAANGSSLLGIAKWSKVTLGRAVVIDEAITFGANDATKSLKHSSVTNVVVRSAVAGGGTTYTVTTDYTVDATAGTITHVSGGAPISITAPTYVSYTWSLTEEDYQLEGKNFWQSNDYVTIQDGRIAVIQPPCGPVFTTEYATNVVYSLSGANSNVYANSSGIFTSSSSSTKLCGKVISVPTAADPYLGFDLIGQVAANS